MDQHCLCGRFPRWAPPGSRLAKGNYLNSSLYIVVHVKCKLIGRLKLELMQHPAAGNKKQGK